jgi:hypothetical protein
MKYYFHKCILHCYQFCYQILCLSQSFQSNQWFAKTKQAASELTMKLCLSHNGVISIPLWDCDTSKIYKICPADTYNLKQWTQQCIQGIPKRMLQRVMTAFPSWLQKCIEDMVATYKVSYSNNYGSDEFSWTRNVPAGANKFPPFCLKILFHFKDQVFLAHPVHYIINIFFWIRTLCSFSN